MNKKGMSKNDINISLIHLIPVFKLRVQLHQKLYL